MIYAPSTNPPGSAPGDPLCIRTWPFFSISLDPQEAKSAKKVHINIFIIFDPECPLKGSTNKTYLQITQNENYPKIIYAKPIFF